MATNSGQVLPPLGTAPFVENNSLVLTRMGLQTLQSIVMALQAAQAVLASLPTPASPSYANDAAAAAGGVDVGGYYRNGSAVQVRVV